MIAHYKNKKHKKTSRLESTDYIGAMIYETSFSYLEEFLSRKSWILRFADSFTIPNFTWSKLLTWIILTFHIYFTITFLHLHIIMNDTKLTKIKEDVDVTNHAACFKRPATSNSATLLRYNWLRKWHYILFPHIRTYHFQNNAQ